MDRETAKRHLARVRLERVRRELARRRFREYLALVHGEGWKRTRLSDFLADTIQEFVETETGNAYDILILETPPQHGKSMTVTESLPSWYMMRKPEARVILSSYSDESAERFTRRNKEKLEAWGKKLAGVEIGKINRATEFELAGHRGRLISRGILAGITGNPCDLLIIDDPIKNREEADSPTQRNKLWAEWLNSLKSRLAAGAKVIVIMTPWHEDDQAARILRTEENVRLVRLPVAAEPTPEEPDPLGRAEGEPLCPEIGKGQKWLDQFRAAYLRDAQGGQRAWLALYMCRPRAERGNIISRDWWRFYDTPPRTYATWCISVDAAFKGEDTNDYVAITVWGKRDEDYYLLDCQNRHLDFIQTLAAIRQTQTRFPMAKAVLIEDKANGSAILSMLQREMYCIPITPNDSKVSRVYGVSPMIESGHVFLPRSAPWLEEYISQWTAFPAAPHDDMVDSSTQALSWMLKIRGNRPAPSEEELARQRAARAERRELTDARGYDPYSS
ncbi:MAG: phage terminase large subunit [Oscillibacter sp.]|nr:phage terminase large subunit [Oscillibacter sp.]